MGGEGREKRRTGKRKAVKVIEKRGEEWRTIREELESDARMRE